VVQLNVDRHKSNLGERVTLSARLLDAYYHPIKLPEVTLTATGPGGQAQQVTLQATPGSPGLYTAEFQPPHVGHYNFALTSPVNPQARTSAALDVEDVELERQRPELDEAALKRIASAGGGRYYRPDALQDWGRSLHDDTLIVRHENEIEMWDAPLLLILFMLPLGLEWLVRKRKGLL
jgi:hypothetical protein